MLKSVLSFLLFGYVNSVQIRENCDVGTGTANDCCIFRPNALEGDGEIVICKANRECCKVDCGFNEKGCEKIVTFYTGAKDSEVICAVQDTCLASKFVGGRGPPGYDQREFQRTEQSLKISITAGSSGKESDIRAFGNIDLTLDSSAQAGFADASLACYNNGECNINCSNEGCEKIDCKGKAQSPYCESEGDPPLFPPMIATPDPVTKACEILPQKGFKGKYIFKNNCESATLNCVGEADICGKAQVFVGSKNFVLNCGGLDPTKTDGTKISGACKEMSLHIGPIADPPEDCTEEDFDIGYEADNALTGELGAPILNTATINLEGSDAMAKGLIDAILTNLNINAPDEKSASEVKLNCGYNPAFADGRAISGAVCTMNCFKDSLTGADACDKCIVETFNSQFVSLVNGVNGVTCTPPLSNKVQQKSINNVNNDLNNNYENDIIIPVKSIYVFAIIFSVIVFAVMFGCYGFNKKNNIEKEKLLKYNTMEMQQKNTIQNIA